MKKILSVLISATLIACILSVGASALVFDFEDTTDTPPVVDGIISEGEYAWTTGELDKLVTFYNEFYVTVEHADAVAVTIEYLFDLDDDYIYLAFKERTTGYSSDVLYDLVFCTADAKVNGEMSLDVSYERNNDLTEAYSPDFTFFVVNSSNALEELDTYVAESNGTYWDDGLRNNNYVELKLDRAAIETLVGGEIVGMGLRMTACTGESTTGETVYGDEESVAYPFDSNPHIGYHFIAFEEGALDNLSAPVETEPVETEPTETEPTETEPTETTPVETEPTETEPVAEGGCGASVAAIAVALVATLGACTAFIIKK